ncbi:hypothetical protein ABZ070_23530 [Streptomyces sp. NPDC006283]|uniref:hypothetical protein n=1 Tax=Streptomyces sp. NPDC006283 TaxID=3156741 RepID=UPI0033A95591
MISEPELVGEERYGAAELPGQRSGTEDVVTTEDAPAASRPSRPAWLWALGGAVVASALWAGGLYVYETRAPDLGGYRASADLCKDAELKAVSAVLGKREGEGYTWGNKHESVDDSGCSADMRPVGYEAPKDEDGVEMGSMPSVTVGYTLHKKTDPGPEFEGTVAARHNYFGATTKLTRIDDLGEHAYIVRDSDSSGITLEVLDGQAVLTMAAHSDWDVDSGEPLTDMAEIEPLLVEDMKALMLELTN